MTRNPLLMEQSLVKGATTEGNASLKHGGVQNRLQATLKITYAKLVTD